jgi:cytochrome P450
MRRRKESRAGPIRKDALATDAGHANLTICPPPAEAACLEEIAMSSAPSPALAPRPDHVPDALVVDYDIFNVPGARADAHLAIRAIAQTAPEIFWTPRNGGHWVAAGGEAVAAMTADHERFSSDCIFVPQKPKDAQREFPIESDPPRHTAIRRPLTVALLPGVVAKREAAIRELAISLIEGVADRGECEFVSEFAQMFPIGIFLDLVQLPAEDRAMLLGMAKRIINGRTPEIRHAALAELIAYLGPVVRARREMPGDDLLSPLVNVIEHDGERIRESDAISYANTVLLAGLDTVAGMLSMTARFLALHPEQRGQLIAHLDDDAFLKAAVEELIRRHGIVGIGRVITGDFNYRGVEMRKDESVILLSAMVGLDDRLNKCPVEVDFSRDATQTHAVFGLGIHACPGAVLARRELKIFLQEWLRRIPDFAIAPDSTPIFTTGFVTGLTELKLVWPPAGDGTRAATRETQSQTA